MDTSMVVGLAGAFALVALVWEMVARYAPDWRAPGIVTAPFAWIIAHRPSALGLFLLAYMGVTPFVQPVYAACDLTQTLCLPDINGFLTQLGGYATGFLAFMALAGIVVGVWGLRHIFKRQWGEGIAAFLGGAVVAALAGNAAKGGVTAWLTSKGA
jgi:hypothetical protein